MVTAAGLFGRQESAPGMTGPWSRHDAVHPVGVTCTRNLRPQAAQKWGGSRARRQV